MEKDILLLYNPKAGDTFFRFELERFLDVFGKRNCTVRVFQSQSEGDMTECLKNTRLEELSMIIVAGGDGTCNEVLQAMMSRHIQIPIGIIPAGTRNNLAKFLEMPEDYGQCIEVLSRMRTNTINVGEVNGHYFIDRCGFGSLASIYHTTKQDVKNIFGKTAYYANGIRQIPRSEPFHLKLETEDQIIEDDFVLFLVINSNGAPYSGEAFGVEQKDRSSADSQLEFIGIRNTKRFTNGRLLLRSIGRIPAESKAVVRIKADRLRITVSQSEFARKELPENMVCVIDGEPGPTAPFSFELHRNALTMLTNQECSTWNIPLEDTEKH